MDIFSSSVLKFKLIVNRLFSLLIRIQALSPLKKKIQDLNTQIISNLNESYREAAIKEAEYLGDGTADYYRSQHIIIPQPTYLRDSNVGQKLQSSMAVSVGQPRMTGQLLNRK